MASATQLPPRPCQRSRFKIVSSTVFGFGVVAIVFKARACAFSSSALVRKNSRTSASSASARSRCWLNSRSCFSSAASIWRMAMSVPSERVNRRFNRVQVVSAKWGIGSPISRSFCSQRAAWRSSASAIRSKMAFRFSSRSRSARSRYTRAVSTSARQFLCTTSTVSRFGVSTCGNVANPLPRARPKSAAQIWP